MESSLVRCDGRGQREMRRKELRTSELTQFDGSAWYAQGLTTVVAAVNGPVAARQEDYRRCDVCVHVKHATRIPNAGGAGRLCVMQMREEQRRSECEMERFLTTCVEAVVLLERFPRCVIEAHLTVLADDGALLSVAVNALMCALLDAGVPCRTTIAAITLAVCAPDTDDGMPPSSSSSSHSPSLLLLLDPTGAEETTDEARSYATATFVLSNAVDSGSVGDGGVLASYLQTRPRSSSFGRYVVAKDLAVMTALAERAAATLFAFFRNCSGSLQ